MSVTTTVYRWLLERVASGTRLPSHAAAARTYARSMPLQWRAPWWAWQLLSWLSVTLLAPTFWVIGILLLINSHSDCPLFWPSTMAIVALTNAVAIVDANQRHHRRRFTGRWRVALRYFTVSLLSGGTLFLLLIWSTDILQDFAGLLSSAVGAASPEATALWTGTLVAGFGVLSFLHASMLHAWLAFEPS